MNADPKFLKKRPHIRHTNQENTDKTGKIYVEGSRPDIQVPMQQVKLSQSSPIGTNGQGNPLFFLYDTSGPYTDSSESTDIKKGLKNLRKDWITERNDSYALEKSSSKFVLCKKIVELR